MQVRRFLGFKAFVLLSFILLSSAPAWSLNWSQQPSGTALWVNQVHFLNENEGWASTTGNTVLHTSNGGATWTPVTPGASGFNSVRFLDASLGWAGGLYSITRTANGGGSWNYNLYPSQYFRNSHFPVSSTVCWAVGGGTDPVSGMPCRSYYRQTFTGSSWSIYQWNYCGAGNQGLSELYMIDANNGIAVGGSGMIKQITNGSGTPAFYSLTSGTTQPLYGVHMLDINVGWVVGGAGTVLKTTDGGATWTWKPSGTTSDLNAVHFIDSLNGWAVGDAGVIVSSTDGGETWAPETSGVSADFRGVYAVSASTCYAVGQSGTILKGTSGSPCTPPSITTHPASQTISTGQSATLSVVANGTSLSYRWYQGMTGDTSYLLSDGPSNVYTTGPLTTTANYWVQIYGSCGQANSSTATVTVSGSACTPPSITTHPAGQTIPTGQSAMLSVVASGTSLSYRWFQGTTGDTSYLLSDGPSNVYTTSALTSTTNYWVQVYNACGQANSSTATVTVTGGGCPDCPIITRIKSRTSKPGTLATIYGTQLTSDKKKVTAYFGTKKAKSIKRASATKITVTIPQGVKGVVPVHVFINGKDSNTVNFEVK